MDNENDPHINAAMWRILRVTLTVAGFFFFLAMLEIFFGVFTKLFG